MPEWDGSVLLGEWPVERTQQMIELFQGVGADTAVQDPAIMVKMFIMGCIDPEFDEEDIPDLLQKSGAVMMRAGQRIMELNGLTQAAQDNARGKS